LPQALYGFGKSGHGKQPLHEHTSYAAEEWTIEASRRLSQGPNCALSAYKTTAEPPEVSSRF